MTTKTASGAKVKKTATGRLRSVKTVIAKDVGAKRKTATAKISTASKNQISPEEIARRTQLKAYEIFEQRGYSHGNDYFDWSVAQEMIRLEVEKAQAKSKAKKKKVSEEELSQKVAQKAYELFERKGYAHGYDSSDWQLAQQLVQLENS